MADRLTESLRDGSVAMKHARGVPQFSNKTLRATRPQKSKMTHFDNKQRDEGKTRSAAAGADHIDQRNLQHTVKGMPSRSGGVQGRDTPKRGHIDNYPRGQHKTFPPGKAFAGGPSPKTGNTKMKAPIRTTGGPEGNNARSPRYYGGPNHRA